MCFIVAQINQNEAVSQPQKSLFFELIELINYTHHFTHMNRQRDTHIAEIMAWDPGHLLSRTDTSTRTHARTVQWPVNSPSRRSLLCLLSCKPVDVPNTHIHQVLLANDLGSTLHGQHDHSSASSDKSGTSWSALDSCVSNRENLFQSRNICD